MLKKVLLPAILAIVIGLAGAAGYSVMQARTSHAAFVIVQDSVAKAHADSVAADSVAVADSVAAAELAEPEAISADSVLAQLLTPADSIRALLAERATMTKGAGATTPPVGKPVVTPPPTPTQHATPTAHAPEEKSDATPAKPSPVVAPVTPAAEALPERRLAKIFSAMSARDAAKVLEQMSDSDIRTILSMMGDRQAAAVLTALPAARAAVISKGGVVAPASTTP